MGIEVPEHFTEEQCRRGAKACFEIFLLTTIMTIGVLVVSGAFYLMWWLGWLA